MNAKTLHSLLGFSWAVSNLFTSYDWKLFQISQTEMCSCSHHRPETSLTWTGSNLVAIALGQTQGQQTFAEHQTYTLSVTPSFHSGLLFPHLKIANIINILKFIPIHFCWQDVLDSTCVNLRRYQSQPKWLCCSSPQRSFTIVPMESWASKSCSLK